LTDAAEVDAVQADSDLELNAPTSKKNPVKVETIQTPPVSDTPLKPKSRWGFQLILLVLLIGSAIYAFDYKIRYLNIFENSSQAQIPALEAKAVTFKPVTPPVEISPKLLASIKQLRIDIDALQKAQAKPSALLDSVQALQNQQSQLQSSYQALYQQQTKQGDERDWQVAEVHYLLRVAQQRLLISQDIKAAKNALKMVDQRLAQAGALFLPVRKQVTRDLHALQQIPSVDISGMSLRLAIHQEELIDLPLLQTLSLPKSKPSDNTHKTPAIETDWQHIGQKIWQDLSGLVTIRHNNSSEVGLLAPTQQHFLKENMRLKLATARLLLLNHETQQFQQAITDLLKWLTLYYDQNASNVQALQTDLQHMQGIELLPELPDISASLKILNQYTTEQ
jgi:uroporphyrin-3 C-methyltransferase